MNPHRASERKQNFVSFVLVKTRIVLAHVNLVEGVATQCFQLIFATEPAHRKNSWTVFTTVVLDYICYSQPTAGRSGDANRRDVVLVYAYAINNHFKNDLCQHMLIKQ